MARYRTKAAQLDVSPGGHSGLYVLDPDGRFTYWIPGWLTTIILEPIPEGPSAPTTYSPKENLARGHAALCGCPECDPPKVGWGLYSIAISAVSSGGIVSQATGYCEARSDNEALGSALARCQCQWPAKDGYRDYCVSIHAIPDQVRRKS